MCTTRQIKTSDHASSITGKKRIRTKAAIRFMCTEPDCIKDFSRSGDRDRHAKSHDSRNKLFCAICDHGTHQLSNLKDHVFKRKHTELTVDEYNKKVSIKLQEEKEKEEKTAVPFRRHTRYPLLKINKPQTSKPIQPSQKSSSWTLSVPQEGFLEDMFQRSPEIAPRSFNHFDTPKKPGNMLPAVAADAETRSLTSGYGGIVPCYDGLECYLTQNEFPLDEEQIASPLQEHSILDTHIDTRRAESCVSSTFQSFQEFASVPFFTSTLPMHVSDIFFYTLDQHAPIPPPGSSFGDYSTALLNEYLPDCAYNGGSRYSMADPQVFPLQDVGEAHEIADTVADACGVITQGVAAALNLAVDDMNAFTNRNIQDSEILLG